MIPLIDEAPENAIVYEPREALVSAIIGMASRASMEPVVAYDYDLLVEAFRKLNDWSDEEAKEWIEFNVTGGYLGPHTPIVIERFSNVDLATSVPEGSVSGPPGSESAGQAQEQ